MFSLSHTLQIFNRVIQFVSVFMVNHMVFRNLAVFLFPYKSMKHLITNSEISSPKCKFLPIQFIHKKPLYSINYDDMKNNGLSKQHLYVEVYQ